MIHNEDISGHKIWRLIYAGLFVVNLIFMPGISGALATALLSILIAFLYYGQQKSINDINSKNKEL